MTPGDAAGRRSDGSADRAPPGRAASDRDLRALLPRTGAAFFGRFRRLTPVQRGAIPHLLAGRNLFVVAPTATGKTEAIMAPLLERHRLSEESGPVILYISPTRALVNDAHRRLEPVLLRLGVRLARKTSDHPGLVQPPPQVLITTPESLDSLLVRRPGYLRGVRAIVLDELHALAGTPRGDQLACLVTRLTRVVAGTGPAGGSAEATSSRGRRPDATAAASPARLQIVSASATVEDGAATARPYFTAGGVLEVPGLRTLAHEVVSVSGPSGLVRVLAQNVQLGFRKVLAFANSRAEVEDLAARLRRRAPFGEHVYAHHGSLSRAERERTEQRFLGARRALCVATLTMELGIDIGDVDLVVLLGPPPGVSALLQRTGRAGRRGQAAKVIAVSRSARDGLLFEHLFASAEEGRLLQDPPVYDPSVALQQALSVCLQNRRREVDARGLLERMPEMQRAYWSQERLTAALRGLCSRDLLEEAAPGIFVSGPDLEEAYRRGTIHANIARDGEIPVWEETTGRVVGSVDPSVFDMGRLTLGGASWEIVRRSTEGLRVAAADASADARFLSRGFPLTSSRLALALKAHLGFAERVLVRFEDDRATHFFHGLGTLWGELLRHAVRGRTAIGRGSLHPAWGISLPGSRLAPSLRLERGRLEAALLARGRRLTPLLPFGPYFPLLPPDERRRAILRLFRIEAFLELAAGFQVSDASSDAVRERLRLFARG